MRYLEHLNCIINITRQMLTSAKSGDWDQVIQLEARRENMLKVMGAVSSDTPVADAIEGLRHLVALNTELTELGVIEKSACLNQFDENQKSKKAFNAYTAY